MAKTTVYTLQVVFNTMDFDCLSVYAFFLIVTVLVSCLNRFSVSFSIHFFCSYAVLLTLKTIPSIGPLKYHQLGKYQAINSTFSSGLFLDIDNAGY